MQFLTHVLRLLAFAACLMLFAVRPTPVSAMNWTEVRSGNFVVVSNAGLGEARYAAARLEEMRTLFSRLPGKDNFDVSVPVTVILFGSDADYEFFKPSYRGDRKHDVAGYFQYNPDIKYIALSTEPGRGHDLAFVLRHEYVHALVKNTHARVPLWFNEGAAQYYSEYELSKDGRMVSFGERHDRSLDALARRELLPLRTLLSIDYWSPYYHEREHRALFYAQSWALVHFLLSDKSGVRRAQLVRYLEAAAGASSEESFRQAFQMDMGRMEGEFRTYVRAARYAGRRELLVEPLPPAPKLENRALSEPEAQAYLGDLLLHTDRPDDAEEYLARALNLDADLAAAHASLGLLRLRQNRVREAKEHLQQAVEIDPLNHLARFYYADLLRREGLETEKTIAGYAATTRLIRAELKKVIELKPKFLEAYALLGLVDLERSPQVDEAIALLRHAATLAPKRQEFNLLLAQIHLRRGEFKEARRIIEPLARDDAAGLARSEARQLLAKVAADEALAAERRAQSDITSDIQTSAAETAPLAETLPCDMPQPGPQYKPMRFEGRQACGQLVRVECEESGVVLFIETAERTLRLRGPALNRVRFVTYTAEVTGRVECGPRSNPVLVTYRAPKDMRSDGEIVAVEFVPPDWQTGAAPR